MNMHKSNLNLVVAGLLLAILMSAMDNTIVATAMATIVSQLGNYDQFVWVTSAYLVTTMAGMPIFGKLSDMYGRKRFFIFGLTVFLIGSALCGLSQSILQLSLFRAIQGIGGGAIMPIAFTIIFDAFPVERRGKMTAMFGAVFGASSVLGPLLGAYITQYISWHWIFYVNIPLGVISLWMILRYYQESPQHLKLKIDWLGAIFMVISVVSLMFALEFGQTAGWTSPAILGLFAAFALFFTLFLFVETKAAEPIISLWLFKQRTFAAAQILAFLYGGTFIILTIFIPIFVSAVYGGSATSSGYILIPMMLGSVAGSAIGGIFQTKTTYRRLMAISVATFALGMLLLSTLTPNTARILLTLYMTLAGFGVGFSFSLLPTASNHNLEQRYRGTANSTNSFLRSFGMTLGITLFGVIQGQALSARLATAFAGMEGGGAMEFGRSDMQTLFAEGARNQIPPAILERIVQAMSDSITQMFLLALIPIGIAALAVLFMGNARVEVPAKPASDGQAGV